MPHIDWWFFFMVAILLFGIQGWFTFPVTQCVQWYCTWKDGGEVDWGANIGYTLATFFCFLYPIAVIYMLYTK